VRFDGVEQIGGYLTDCYVGMTEECPVLLLLNGDNELIGDPILLGFGMKDCSPISLRRIVAQALQDNASSIVLAHNHPGADSTPSMEDISFTQLAAASLQLLQIRLVDHIIVGKDGYSCVSERDAENNRGLSVSNEVLL